MSSLISIIIPIYNAEQYLAECLDSVLAQTYTNFELLLIDDGSKDASADICKRYAMSDERIRYIYQENAGVSAARNRGLDEAKGEYISFVDADDVLSLCCMQLLYDAVRRNQENDMSICGVHHVLEGGQKISCIAVDADITLDKESAVLSLFKTNCYMSAVWAKLYKKSLITRAKLRFDSRFKYGEDTLFNYWYLQSCRRVSCLHDGLYQYRIDNLGSVMNFDNLTNQFNRKRLEDEMILNIEILEHTKTSFASIVYKNGCARFFNVCKKQMISYMKFGCTDESIYRMLKSKMRKTLWNNLLYRGENIKGKLFNCLLTFAPILLRGRIKQM